EPARRVQHVAVEEVVQGCRVDITEEANSERFTPIALRKHPQRLGESPTPGQRQRLDQAVSQLDVRIERSGQLLACLEAASRSPRGERPPHPPNTDPESRLSVRDHVERFIADLEQLDQIDLQQSI